ncbi:phosphotransferase [Auraticoccus monumenti]|uniref:Phosphotransferase enzyme family protein n=1 Tax=Auraticoccus monumenti TaxID=675864 RepID=A0A1G6XRZ0_9ACTN|nr:phosphotransferase [Auraticoccus monumenti]SDD80205.1 Phosphotransferase enzyme family protein [Auraticoccus monumenti]
MERDDPDGSRLLTSRDVGDLLSAAVEHSGGQLVDWRMEHVDANPQHSTTATYNATVQWPFGRREELLGVSARVGGPAPSDERAEIFAAGSRQLAVWIYPKDPDLPGLVRAAYPAGMAEVLNEHRVLPSPVRPEQVALEMIAYRPRRRAVLRATVTTPGGPVTFYVKVLRRQLFAEVERRHLMLLEVGVPAPPVAASTSDHLLVLRELSGRPLAKAIFDPHPPTSAERLIGVLDAMPAAVSQLQRRPPWTDSVQHYTVMVQRAMPGEQRRLDWITAEIQSGLAGTAPGDEPTHGDFHEGQVHVDGGRVVGVLDVDTIGPGRRVDDLACMVAHLSTVQRMNTEQAARVRALLAGWVPVFDTRVDPTELRLRAAAVIISLATGPYRSQEPHWERETSFIIDAAEALVRQVR